MYVERVGTFQLDGEAVTGIFVSVTTEELRAIRFNPLMAHVELHQPETVEKQYKCTGRQHLLLKSAGIDKCDLCGENI